MRRLFKSLTFKIGIMIILVEIAVLAISGSFYVRRFKMQVNERVQARVELPGMLVKRGLLSSGSVADTEMMTELVGEELIDGLIVGFDKQVRYSLNPAHAGREITELAGMEPTWFDEEATGGLVKTADGLVSITPVLQTGDYGKSSYFVYIKVGTRQAEREKRAIGQLFVLGSIFSLVSTSLIIILSFKLIILTRITDVADVLGRVRAGDLTARTSREISEDEIGALQLGVNAMVGALEQRTEERKAAKDALQEYSERLEDMVEERTTELQDAQQELLRQEKLATLGQLAGGVAHELRNPLGAIKNAVYFVNMVLQEPDTDVHTMLQIIDKEVGTCERIISSLLDFARTRGPVWQEVDVNHVVREALARVAVPENIQVTLQLDESLPIIQADARQLDQALGNLILNAVQAMPGGGLLTIQTSARSVEPSQISGSGWVCVSIGDEGAGIAPANLSRLFEPLFTTKARGIGLGLTLSKNLIQGHGGKIQVQSQVGEGSTFTVHLPADVN